MRKLALGLLVCLTGPESNMVRAQTHQELRQGLKCLERKSGTDYEKIGRCVPLSPPHEVHGVWIVGFEMSDFLEGRNFPPKEMDYRYPGISLIFPKTQSEQYVDNRSGEPRAYLLRFVGRNSLKNDQPPYFLVDRLISIRRVPMPAMRRPLKR